MSLKTSDQTEGLWLKGMYTNVHLCAKFGDWKPTINEKLHVSEQGTETTFHKETVIFLSTKCFMNNNWSWQKLKPWVMLWDQGGDQPSKIWEKLDFSSNSAWFLRSLVSTIWREAKESNLQRSERPIGSRAVKCWHTAMRDLHVFCVRFSHGSVLFDVLFSHGRALFDLRNVQKRATKSDTSGYCLCNWSIWCQGKSPTIGCMMAHLKTQPVRGEQTEQNSRWGGGNLDCSVHSSQFLAFTR